MLVGGKSTRMGRDKALLPFAGGVLVEHVAAAVAAAAGTATLIGDPESYGHLGFPVLADGRPGEGPAGGIETALRHTRADWNLVLACDMPRVSAEFLRHLLEAAELSGADALAPAGPSGRPEPLSAVYHRRCAAALSRALDAGVRKVTGAIAGLDVRIWPVQNAAWFENLNTPEEWASYRDDAH